MIDFVVQAYMFDLIMLPQSGPCFKGIANAKSTAGVFRFIVLLPREAGGLNPEGRKLQFYRHVLNFELQLHVLDLELHVLSFMS